MAEVPDINVDELRRRARRRLIGAIVLALAAAVIVPMLLESEPKPLGEDVSVKIPPEDNGKFVNRLSDRLSDKTAKPKAADAATEPAKEPAKPEPSKEDTTKAETATPVPPAPAPPPAAPREATSAATAPTESAPAPSSAPAPRKSVAQAEQKMLGPTGKPPAAAPAPAPAPATVAAAAATHGANAVSAEAAKEGFSVQLAAFADDKGANSLVNKLKRAAYPAYTEPLSTSRGTLWRVRVGPYPSRDAAIEVRDRLKGEGYNGIVAAAK